MQNGFPNGILHGLHALMVRFRSSLSGKEVSKAIRKVSPGMKVLFASGYNRNMIKLDELTAAGFDFIHKPFESKDFLRKVREILDR